VRTIYFVSATVRNTEYCHFVTLNTPPATEGQTRGSRQLPPPPAGSWTSFYWPLCLYLYQSIIPVCWTRVINSLYLASTVNPYIISILTSLAYLAHGILFLYMVWLFCVQYDYFVYSILFCARHNYFVHRILILCAVYLFSPRDTDRLSAFNKLIPGNSYFVHKFLLTSQRRGGSSCPLLN
jgi:hypothetical protein